jgi:hypothetical protein
MITICTAYQCLCACRGSDPAIAGADRSSGDEIDAEPGDDADDAIDDADDAADEATDEATDEAAGEATDGAGDSVDP